MVEEIFGWMKTVGNLRKTRHRGVQRVGWIFTLTAVAYNLVRLRNLMATVSPWSAKDSGNVGILPATGQWRRQHSRVSSAFARHKGTEVFLKEETQLNCIGFSTAC
jgi:hypothetical protein